MTAENSLDAQDLAEFAEAAIILGRIDIAEELIAAAYDRGSDAPSHSVNDVLVALRDWALDGGHDVALAVELTKVIAPAS